jgi:glycolate oxidase FAD binding subunit
MAVSLAAPADELAERVTRAAAQREPLTIRGGGSKAFLGPAPQGELLHTQALGGIVSYQPDELVVTAGAGTRLDELDAVLAIRGQMLACEAPRFSPDTTLGGMIAAGLAGPRRPWGGSVRDQLLGCEIIDGRGRRLRFGGQVMKNVAGYDVTRLMAGAFGTLGLVISASLRVWPQPRVEQTRALDCDPQRARERVLDWGRRGLPLSAAFHVDDRLWVRLSGSAAGVAAAGAEVGGVEAEDTVWGAVRDHRHPYFELEPGEKLWRLSVPPAAPWHGTGRLTGRLAIGWAGAERWLATRAAEADVHAEAARLGGHAQAFRGPAAATRPAPGAVLARLQDAVRRTFDPQGILNPGWLKTGG